MKKFCYLLILISNQVYAQNTWFKLFPGWGAQTNFIYEDTLITIGTGFIGSAVCININYSNIKTGEYYYTDTIDYYQISKDTNTSNEHRTSYQSIYDKETKKLTIGFNYIDILKGKYKWQSAIFTANPLKKLPYLLNYDTFDTKIEGYQKIGNNYFAKVFWEKHFGALGTTSTYKLLKLNKDSSTTLIKQEAISSICTNCHQVKFDKLHGDNQNQSNLFLEMTDNWDWHGGPAQWQVDLVKLDLKGNTLWKCRPNNRDSVNSGAFQMVQKPSGNILCCWSDLYHPPHKNPTKDYPYESVNDSATIWFAEIDYKTGKVLWRKNIRKYLFSKFTLATKEEDNRTFQDVIFSDAQLVNDNSILWTGHRSRNFLYPIAWKRFVVLLKTDLLGNPIWYREYEIIPGDSCDKGMEVFSFIQTLDKGFILAGSHLNLPFGASGCEQWQKAALLKLDSFGCWKEGCQGTDGINKIINSPKICKVFPNPAYDKLFIEFPPNLPNGWQIKVTDVLGKNIEVFNYQTESIDIGNYPAGLYFIHLQNINSNQNETHKISIKH